jgi:putative membrane protein
MLQLTPIALLINMIVVSFPWWKDKNINLLMWFLITFVFTLVIEIIGVKTGIIFGEYEYGKTLGIKLFDVPIIIGLNWVFVILGGILLAQKITDHKIILSLIASLFAVSFDFILEPVAIKLDYWSWENNMIPFQNFIAWFIISFIAAWLFTRNKIEVKNDLPLLYLIVQSVFFVVLQIAL